MLLFAVFSGPEPPPLPQPAEPPGSAFAFPLLNGLPRAVNVRVIDGDTIDADIVLSWGVTLRRQRIRAADFDAWESSRRRRSVEVTDAEVRRGKAASAGLAAMLNGCSLYLVPQPGEERDRYGRVLAIWLLACDDGQPVRVRSLMAARGYLRE
jgi:endonuclease YncB( thermonuclease family)